MIKALLSGVAIAAAFAMSYFVMPFFAMLSLSAPAAAQDNKPNVARVVFVPTNKPPPMPAGLQLACVSLPNAGAPTSETCPVVQYKGISTWAFSYQDNRTSLALVSYNADNKIVRNVEKPGARYIWDMLSRERTQTVLMVGQAENRITVNWSELGP